MNKHYSVVTGMDDGGKGLVKEAKLPNDDQEIVAFFEGWRRNKARS